MGRKIIMRGKGAQYVEIRAAGAAPGDDGREIVMEGDSVCYKEMAGVATVQEKTVVTEITTASPKHTPTLPDSLATAVAQVYWQRLKDAGFVDDDCMLLSTTTRLQTWYIAELFAEKLNVKRKWKLFQDFWNIKNLAQYKLRSQDIGELPARHEEIERIFGI